MDTAVILIYTFEDGIYSSADYLLNVADEFVHKIKVTFNSVNVLNCYYLAKKQNAWFEFILDSLFNFFPTLIHAKSDLLKLYDLVGDDIKSIAKAINIAEEIIHELDNVDPLVFKILLNIKFPAMSEVNVNFIVSILELINSNGELDDRLKNIKLLLT